MNFEVTPEFLTEECQSYCLRVADGTHDSPKEVAAGKLLITSKNIKEGRVVLDTAYHISESDFEEINKRSKVDQWDIILTMIGTVGALCLIDFPQPEFAIKNVGLLKCGDELRAKWLYYFLMSPIGQALIEQRKKGSTQQYISLGEIRKLPISYPADPAHMRSVTDILSNLDKRIALLRETNATLEAIAQALFKSWFVDFDPVCAKHEGRMPEGMDEATAGLFPESFEESEFGAVPRGWRATTLGSICAENGGVIQTGPFGSQLHASDYRDAGVPVVMPQDLAGRRVQVDKIARVGDTDANRLIRHQLQSGDIVFSRRGDVGRHALVGERETGWLCGTGCLLVRPGQSWPSFTYLSLALDRAVAKEWLLRHAVGATMPNLNTGILSAVPIMRPDDRILRAFDGIVSALDERISHCHANIRTLVELRDTLLPRLLSGQVRLPGAVELMKHAA